MATPVPSSDAERDAADAARARGDVREPAGGPASASRPPAPGSGGGAVADRVDDVEPTDDPRYGDGSAEVAPDEDDGPIPDDVAPNARPATRRRIWKVRQRRARHKQRSRAFRIAYGVVASLVLIAGLVSGPLPGPGPVILIPLGLAMLAAEFLWAERALAFAMDKAEGAKEGAAKASPRQRLLIAGAIVAGVAAAVSAVFVLGIPIPLLNPNP